MTSPFLYSHTQRYFIPESFSSTGKGAVGESTLAVSQPMLIANRLFDICSSLGMIHLATLPMSDPEVEKFIKGVPISLLNARWAPRPLEAPVQENGCPPKRQTQSESQPEHPLSTSDSPCADARPPRNGFNSHIGPGHWPSPAGGGIPTPDSTASVSNSECDEDVVELPEDEGLRPPFHLPTVSAIPEDGVESDRASLICAAALESPAPGTTQRRPPSVSTDEVKRCPSQSTTMNYFRYSEVSAQNIVDDSDPGHFESRDDQSPSPSSLTTDVPSVSRAVPDTAGLSNLGHPIEHAHHQPGTHATAGTSNSKEYGRVNAIELSQAAPSTSPFRSQLLQPPGSIADNGSRSSGALPSIESPFSGQVPGSETRNQAQAFCESGNPNATLVSPERMSEPTWCAANMDAFHNDLALSEVIDFDWPQSLYYSLET